jgi:hypothetical protein
MYALLALLLTLFAQCGPLGCPAPRYAPRQAIAAPACNCSGSNCPADCALHGCDCKITWQPVAGHPEQLARYAGQRHVGSWNSSKKEYRSYDAKADKWGEPVFALEAADGPASTIPAVSAIQQQPKKEAPAPHAEQNFGLQGWDKPYTGPKFSDGNGGLTKQQVYESMDLGADGDQVSGDGKKPFVACISGDPAACAEFARDWKNHPALAAYRDRLRLKIESPNDPILKDRDGKPLYYTEAGIYVVAADGKQLGRMDLADYQGPEQLAESLRAIDPTFDPTLVPDMANPPVAGDDPDATFNFVCTLLSGLASLGAVLMFGIGAYLYIRNGKRDVRDLMLSGNAG